MYTQELPKGYAQASVSTAGVLSVIVPPFRTEIQVNHGTVPPLIECEVPFPVLMQSHLARQWEYGLYALERIGSKVLASPLGLANVWDDGRICWGRGNPQPDTLDEAWVRYWTSPFNLHLAPRHITEIGEQEATRWYNNEGVELKRKLTEELLAKAKWRRRGVSNPYEALVARLQPRLDRNRIVYDKCLHLIQQIDVQLQGAATADTIPMMRRRDKVATLHRRCAERINKTSARIGKARDKWQKETQAYLDLRAGWGSERFDGFSSGVVKRASNSDYVAARERVLEALANNKLMVMRAIHDERKRRLTSIVNAKIAEEKRRIHEAAVTKAAIVHFTGGWMKAHNYRHAASDLIGQALIAIPPNMDFVGLFTLQETPLFVKERMQHLLKALHLCVPTKHSCRDNPDYRCNQPCKKKHDHNVAAYDVYICFGKRIDSETSIVNFGGKEPLVARGKYMVSIETFEKDPAIFDKIAAEEKAATAAPNPADLFPGQPRADYLPDCDCEHEENDEDWGEHQARCIRYRAFLPPPPDDGQGRWVENPRHWNYDPAEGGELITDEEFVDDNHNVIRRADNRMMYHHASRRWRE